MEQTNTPQQPSRKKAILSLLVLLALTCGSGFHLQQPLGRDLDRAGPALLLAGAAGAGHRPDIPPA